MKRKLLIYLAIILVAAIIGLSLFLAVMETPAESPSLPAQSAQSKESYSSSSSAAPAPVETTLDGQVGHLTFEGTDIDNPVMQGEDNEQYLRKNEQGQDDVWGCYFLDYACTPSSQNLIIYGHSLDDHTDAARFSQLKRLSDPAFAQEHHTFELQYAGEAMTFEVISAGRADAERDTFAIIANPSADQAQQILDAALARSEVQFEAAESAKATDRLLTLSTCTADSSTRYVVTAVRVA